MLCGPLGHQLRRTRESFALRLLPMQSAWQLFSSRLGPGVLLLARALDPASEQLRVGSMNDDAACLLAQLGCLFLARQLEP